MKKILVRTFISGLAAVVSVNAQNAPNVKQNNAPETAKDAKNMEKADTKKADSAAETVQAAVKAHGGDALKNIKTLQVLGSVDVSSSSVGINLSGSFAAIFADEKYRLQIITPFYSFTQAFDGANTLSSMDNFTLPAYNRIGLPLLLSVGKSGFVVLDNPNLKKGGKGFRIKTPEGFEVDYTLDDKTNQIKSYTATYNIRNRTVTTIVEHDKFKTVEGVVVPERYAQRFEMGEMSVYADFKAKEIKVNAPVDDSVFTSLK